jgi:hypothetical protein
MIKDTIEKLLFKGQRVSEEERAQLLDWLGRAESMAEQKNPITGQITPGTAPADIVNMIDEALKSRNWVNNLGQISNQFGLLVAGELRSGNGQVPGDGFTGGRFGYPGFTYGATEYFLAGVANDVLQIGLSLTDGKLYAGAGAVVLGSASSTIGGWVIGPDYIQAAGGLVGLQTTVTGGDDIRIWAGNVAAASAPFRVYESGLLVASNAIIEGTIEAQSGSIGGWAITASTFQSVLTGTIGITLDSQNAIIEVGDSAGTYIEIDGFNRRIRSSNFATGATGFNIDADTGDAEFNNITARGELKTFLLTSSNQMAVGGSIIVSQDSGKLGADVSSGATTVNFGKAMTTGDWIKIQGPDSAGSNALEWMLIGSNVSGFTYNVTRNVDGSGANNWLKDTPFVVIGANGDSRIEIVAGASGSIQLITQGAAWNTQTVQASMSTVAGAITAGAGDVTIDGDGIWITNQQAAFGFEDTNGDRFNIFLSSSATDDLDLVNSTGTGTITLRIDTSTHAVLDFIFGEDPGTAEAARIFANPPSGKAVFQLSDGVRICAGINTVETVFNEDSFDIDHRFEGATDASLLVLDAGLDAIGMGGAAESGYKLKVTGNVNLSSGSTYGINGTPVLNGSTRGAAAETNGDNIFAVTSPGGPSLFVATINGAPSGTSVVYNAPSSGTEGVLVPTAAAQLAKMRLYNTTRGNSALISNCNTGTNTITLTATVPANWASGDTITVASQTVSGGGFNWVDLEITSGPTGKSALLCTLFITSGAAGDGARCHPLATFAGSKTSPRAIAQVAATQIGAFGIVPITSNAFSFTWTANSTQITLVENGYLL